MPELMVDVITSVDGFSSAEGWPGLWGMGGPEYYAWLDEDAAGLRGLLAACDEVIVAQSCDKNFSVYRDRVGSLFVKTGSASATATAMGHVFQRAREMWSMPPDHGAAAVRIILDDAELRGRWLVELAGMRDRINSLRNNTT